MHLHVIVMIGIAMAMHKRRSGVRPGDAPVRLLRVIRSVVYCAWGC